MITRNFLERQKVFDHKLAGSIRTIVDKGDPQERILGSAFGESVSFGIQDVRKLGSDVRFRLIAYDFFGGFTNFDEKWLSDVARDPDLVGFF